MEKPNQEKEDDSSDAQVAEDMVEEEPQTPEAPESLMQDDQIRRGVQEISTESSVAAAGSASCESGHIPQPKVEKCDDSMQNVPEELIGSTGMEHEAAADESKEEVTIKATKRSADDAATEKVSESSEQREFRISIDDIVQAVMDHSDSSKATHTAVGVAGNVEIPERIEERQNVPHAGVGRNLETVEQPERELQLQHVDQVIELVVEEAVVRHARQEQMEEAEEIEEPQKYAFREKDND